MSIKNILNQAAHRGISYREQVNGQSPYPRVSAKELRELFDTGLSHQGRAAEEVLTQLADAAEAGLVGLTGNAFYGWVMGPSNTVGVAADWLTSSWGQNAAIYQTAPSAAIAEEVAGKWLIDLLGLPKQSSIAFSTGATMSSFICLAAARSEVLKRYGWDVEVDGLFGAPEIRVFLSEEAHSTIFAGLRYLGFGQNRLVKIAAHDDGQMDTADLAEKLKDQNGPAIIISQAGHINTGAFDDFHVISAISAQHNAWHHVDGAFGLWANSSPILSHCCDGVDKADSWSVDGHKMLQIPYDSGFAIVKHPTAHRRAMATTAGYLNESDEDGRNPTHYVPELSRRARGFAVWAVLQHLGRAGVRDIIEGNALNTVQLAQRLSGVEGIRILHPVILNQLALVFEDSDGPSDALTLRMAQAIQNDKRWFVKEAQWRDSTILRFSFSSAPKTKAQIDEFADALIEFWRRVRDDCALKRGEVH